LPPAQLNANYFYRRIRFFNCCCYALNHPTSSNRDHYYSNLWYLLKNFETNRPLSGHNKRIIIWRNVDGSLFVFDSFSIMNSLFRGSSTILNVRPISLNCFLFRSRNCFRYNERRFHLKLIANISNSLSVITRRSCHNSGGSISDRSFYFVSCPSDFKSTCPL